MVAEFLNRVQAAVPLKETLEASIYKANVAFYTARNWGLSEACKYYIKQSM